VERTGEIALIFVSRAKGELKEAEKKKRRLRGRNYSGGVPSPMKNNRKTENFGGTLKQGRKNIPN